MLNYILRDTTSPTISTILFFEDSPEIIEILLLAIPRQSAKVPIIALFAFPFSGEAVTDITNEPSSFFVTLFLVAPGLTFKWILIISQLSLSA